MKCTAPPMGRKDCSCFFSTSLRWTITDLRMPVMDGFQLTSRIREMSDGHILVLTALGGQEHEIRGLEVRADAYLVKPVRKRVFLARVRSLHTVYPLLARRLCGRMCKQARLRGLSLRAIACELGIHRNTAHKYALTKSPPLRSISGTTGNTIIQGGRLRLIGHFRRPIGRTLSLDINRRCPR